MNSSIRMRAASLTVATATALSLGVVPAEAANGIFTVKGDNPTLQDWTKQMKYMLNPNTPDAGLAANLEAGKSGVAAAKFFRNTGNSNKDWHWKFEGPTKTTATVSTAYFHQGAPGYPTVRKPAKWKKINGNWRISNETLCHYINVYKLGAKSFCK